MILPAIGVGLGNVITQTGMQRLSEKVDPIINFSVAALIGIVCSFAMFFSLKDAKLRRHDLDDHIPAQQLLEESSDKLKNIVLEDKE